MSTLSAIPGLLTLTEAAEIIGVSHAQCSRYVAEDMLSHVPVGNQKLIPEKEVRSFKRPLRGNPAFRKQKRISKKN